MAEGDNTPTFKFPLGGWLQATSGLILSDSPYETLRATFNPNELITSPVQFQESDLLHMNTVKMEINSVTTEINSVKTEINSVTTAINSVKTEINTVVTAVNTVKTEIDTVVTAINTVKTEIDPVVTAVNAVKTEINAVVTAVDTVPTTITTVPTTITAVPTTITNVPTTITTVPTTITTVPTTITAVPTTITAVPTKITTVPTEIDTVSTAIDTVATAIDTVATAINTVPTAINTVPTTNNTVTTDESADEFEKLIAEGFAIIEYDQHNGQHPSPNGNLPWDSDRRVSNKTGSLSQDGGYQKQMSTMSRSSISPGGSRCFENNKVDHKVSKPLETRQNIIRLLQNGKGSHGKDNGRNGINYHYWEQNKCRKDR